MKLIFDEWLERNGYSSVEEAVGAPLLRLATGLI